MWCADQAGHERGLRDRQLLHVFAKVQTRRFPNTVDADRAPLTEIDLVEIELKDGRFRIARLHHHGHDHFSALAPDRALRGQKEIFDELLRQRTAPFSDASSPHIAIERSQDTEPIDASMGVKAAILNGDDRLDEVRWNVADLDELPLFALWCKKPGVIVIFGEAGTMAGTASWDRMIAPR